MYAPDIVLPKNELSENGLSENMAFRTELQVYINDLAGGLHVGNHTLIGYLNEVQMRFITALGFPTLLVDNAITYNTELVVQYHREVRYGDVLTVHTHIDPLEDRQYRILYHMQNQHGKTVLKAQMGMVFVDQATGKRCDVPEAFRNAWLQFAARS